MASIDLETGKKYWEKRMDDARGFFYNLSSAIEYRGTVHFILTTGCDEIFTAEYGYCKEAESIYTTTRLFTLEVSNGEIIEKESIPSRSAPRLLAREDVVETENYFVYTVDGKVLMLKRKNP